MRLIERLFGRSAPGGNLPDPATCPHPSLLARYRNNDVLGDESQAMGYKCQRCLAEFLPRQVHAMRARAGSPASHAAPEAARANGEEAPAEGE